MKLKFLIPIILLTALSSCGSDDKKPVARAAKAQYKIMTLATGHITSMVQLPGVLEPFEFVQLYPKISGFVKEVHVDRGSMVKQGMPLIRLEAPEVEEHVSEARLKYAQANAVYQTSKDRYERLLETSKTPGTVAAYDLSAAQSKMQADAATAQSEQAAYKAQQDMQAYLTVNAPFDGVITERNVHPGALVGPGTQGAKPMLILQQQSKLRLVVNVPEQYSAQVNNGDVAHFKVNALPGQDFKGTVSRSSGNLSSNFRSETIEVDVLNADNTFKPGMYAEVILPVGGSINAYVVPKSAVITTTEHKYVITSHDGKAHLIDVTQGNEHGDSTEVFGSLYTGDVVVTNGGYQVKEGEKL